MTSNVEIRRMIAKNQIALERIVELTKGINTKTQIEAMLLTAVKLLSEGFTETLERLAEKIK